ncbi:MAG: hypothetical protein R2705_11650 [Ilumatobacteraceae bacterium]
MDVWRYRELWSRLNPQGTARPLPEIRARIRLVDGESVVLLVVYTIVFKHPRPVVRMVRDLGLVGVLVWNFVSTSLATGARAIVQRLPGREGLPREVLPLASVGAALVHLMLSTGLLVAVLAVTRFGSTGGISGSHRSPS